MMHMHLISLLFNYYDNLMMEIMMHALCECTVGSLIFRWANMVSGDNFFRCFFFNFIN